MPRSQQEQEILHLNPPIESLAFYHFGTERGGGQRNKLPYKAVKGKGGATKSDDFWKIKEVGEIIPTTPASSRAHIESEEHRKLVYWSQNSTKRLVNRPWRVGLFDFGSGSGRVWPKSSGFGSGSGIVHVMVLRLILWSFFVILFHARS